MLEEIKQSQLQSNVIFKKLISSQSNKLAKKIKHNKLSTLRIFKMNYSHLAIMLKLDFIQAYKMLQEYVKSRKVIGKLPPGCVRNEWMTISSYVLKPKVDTSCISVNNDTLHKSYTSNITAIH